MFAFAYLAVASLTCLLSSDILNSDAKLDYIVEPWFKSEAGSKSPGGAEFAEFEKTLQATRGVKFFSKVEDVPPPEDGVQRLAIISAREY